MKATDAELVERVRGVGDAEAFGELVRRYQGHVYGLAYAMVGDWAEAQDLAQDAFLRAYVNLHQLKDSSKFAPWVRRVAFGTCMDWLRVRRPEVYRSIGAAAQDVDDLALPTVAGPSPAEVAEQRELAAAVLEAVRALPAKYRLPLMMFHLDGLSYDKVAEFLDVPVGTAKSLISRAKRMLKPALARYAAEEVGTMVEEVFAEYKLPATFAERVARTVDAIKRGDVDELALLLKADPRLANAPDPTDRRPPLFWAGMYGYNARSQGKKPVVDLLLARGAEVDVFAAAYLNRPERMRELLDGDAGFVRATDDNGWTPLHYAAEVGAVEVAKLLIERGADVNARTRDGKTAIDFASHPGPWKPRAAGEIVTLLRERGAEVDVWLAAGTGDIERLKDLATRDPEVVHVRDRDGSTPLFWAAKNLHADAARWLLDHGADPNARRPDGQTPVSTAVGHMWDSGGPEVVRLLEERGAKLDMYEAAKLGRRERVEELLRDDPTTARHARWDETAVSKAAYLGHTEIGRMLAAAGGDVPLHVAAALGLEDVVGRMLDEALGRVDERDERAYTPLLRAAEAGQARMCEVLVRRGATVDARNEFGATALWLVATPWERRPRDADAAVAEVLIRAGADLHARDQHHEHTPLHGTVFSESVAVARVLLAHGARLDLQNRNGDTPVEMAQKMKRTSISEVLRAGG